MAVCPNGHDSASDDFCDVCGMRILSQASAPPPPIGVAPDAPLGAPAGGGPQAADPGQLCPVCGAERVGAFCESCGFNFAAAQLPTPPTPPGQAAQAAPAALSAPPAPPPPPAPPVPSATPASSGSAFPSVSWDQPVPSAPPVTPVPTELSLPVTQAPPAPQQAPSQQAPSQQAPSQQAPPPPYPPPPASALDSSSRPAPPYALVTWTAVVSSDRDYYDMVRAESGPEGQAIDFPAYCAERRFRLSGSQVQIGRRSVSRGLDPEIDLTGPPADPGISRLHAVLIAQPDGTWSVLDPGSANGTRLNGTPIPTDNPVPLHDGDRINLGAWTAITVHSG
jgi:pSer/pThr/pTyr-binding forkhead associated (FHA) protein